nr:non-ribosomal peptide synthetase [Microvirga calopogonii]
MDDQRPNSANQDLFSSAGLHSGRTQVSDGNGIRGEASPYPSECVHELFEKQVRRNGSAVAVRYLDQVMTYEELNARANRIAQHLRSLGVQPTNLIGVCLSRCPDLVAALLGVWKAGATYVPLDPTYPRERLRFIVEDSAVSCILTAPAQAELFDGKIPTVLLDGDAFDTADLQDPGAAARTSPSALAYVMYTSGSTGKPKGAMITHSGLVNYLTWAIGAYDVQSGCIVPVHSSIAFDLTVTSLYPALLVGGAVELLPESEGGQELIKAMRQGKRYALVKITPAHLEMVTQELSETEIAASTAGLVIGGENLRAEILEKWRVFAPQTRIFNEYGPTETVVGCCVHEMTTSDPHQGSVSIGRPISNTQLYILDSELNPLPNGEVGELYIGGDGVAEGYLNRPALTAERFLPDPFTPRMRARLYKTGDLVKMNDDDTLVYLGRIDHQVKIRGYRVELGEIEQTMLEHPEIQSCLVLADAPPGGLPFLTAYLIAGDRAPTELTLREFIAARLPEHMMPQRFAFVERFPLTNNGKVDRDALVALASAPGAPSHDPTPNLPNSAIVLSRIWGELLRREDIGIDDDIFSLGAYSLLVTRALTRIRSELKANLNLRDIFENPTIGGQSELVEGLLLAARPSPRSKESVREEIEI